MKNFILILIFICLSSSTRLFAQQSQKITLSVKNVPFETILDQIKKQTGVTFFYNEEVLKAVENLSVKVEKADLQTVLDICLKNTQVTYNIVDNLVVFAIKKAKKPTADGQSGSLNTFTKTSVQGFVYNIRKEGIGDASVIVKRTHQGTITNSTGEFAFDDIRTNDTLRVSFIGYETKVIPLNGKTNPSIILNETKNELDQVVVQAYGTTTKRLTVGEVTQINAAQIERQPVQNPIQALEGLVPGLLVTPTSGYASAPVKVELRGRNSIDPNSTSDPLYIIDGVPLITLDLGMLSGPYAGPATSRVSAGLQQSGSSISGGQSPFFSLNPNDIESITVLKDAEATAMYGSRAGNGVIIITTKKGKPGETQFNIGVDRSVNKTVGQWDMLNTSQYLQMRREALRNSGLTPTIANAPDLTLWDTTRYTNWQKELWKTSNTTDVNTSLSGGNNFLTFRMSAAYSSIQDLAAFNTENNNRKATVSLNLNYTSLNQKLSVSLSASYGYTSCDLIGSSVSNTTLAPDLPPVFDKNGNLNYAAWNAAGIGNSFPFSGLLNPFLSNTYLLNSNLNISYKIIKGLNFSTNLGYNNAQANNSSTNTIASQNPINNPLGSANFGNNSNIGFNINPQLTYSHYIGKGKLDALIGGTLNNTNAQGITLVGSGYTSDALLKSIENAPVQVSYQAYAQNKYLDLHGRLNYNWANKYILEVSGNRDGSSSFGPGRQFGNFWSTGGNWIASEEKFVKNVLPTWVSLIKFNATYGTTGVSGGDYQYLSQWSGSLSMIGSLYNYNGSLALVPIHAVNQDYHWETDRQLNTGMSLGFLNDRIGLNVTYYRKRVGDQLTQLPTPIFSGFTSVEGNSQANVQNSGWESSINAMMINTKTFSWSANFNISANRNKLLAFPGIQYSPFYYTEKVGTSVNTIYLLHYSGIDPQTGQRAYTDANHDGMIQSFGPGSPGTGTDDRFIPLDLSPKYYGGAGTSLRYKDLTLNLTFNFEKKMTQVAYTSVAGGMLNVPVSIFNNHWQKPGDMAANPRFTAAGTNSDILFSQSDGFYTDGSFLRLQNVAIAYALPNKFSNRLGINGLRFMLSIQNVFTLTKYYGIDPDAAFGTLPQPKIFNGKIVFNL